MNEYFPEPKPSGERAEVKLDLSNYATKADLKNVPGDDIWKFANKVDLASFKSEFDKLDIDKLEKVPTGLKSLKIVVDKTVPVDLSKLSDAVKNDVVKKDIYNAKIKDIQDKIPNVTNFRY